MKTRWPWLALGIALLVAAVGFQALPLGAGGGRPGRPEDHRARHERQPGDDLERLRQQPLRRPRDRHQRLQRRHRSGPSGSSSSSASTPSSRRSARCRSASTAARGSARCSSRPRRRCASARRASPPGTKGIQRGPVVILKADPFSIPGRAQGGQPVPKENVEKKRAAVAGGDRRDQRQQGRLQGRLGPDRRREHRLRPRRPPRLEAPDGSPEYLDAEMMPPLTKALVDAGALGTIQSATPPSPHPAATATPSRRSASSTASSRRGTSCRSCPTSSCSTRSTTRSRRWSRRASRSSSSSTSATGSRWGRSSTTTSSPRSAARPTPTSTSSSAGTSTASAAATGGVDDGSGFAPGMEAIRLITAAGAKPKRSIVFIALRGRGAGPGRLAGVAEEAPGARTAKIVMMINRDGSPSAITGATVPETWYADFQKITAPLATLNPKWPFKLERGVPRAHATSPGGTDSSSFEMQSIPTLNFATTTRGRAQTGRTSLRLPLRLAHDQRPLQRAGALHGAPAALRAGRRRWWPTAWRTSTSRSRATASTWPTASTPTMTIGSGDDAAADHDHARLRERAARDGELRPHRRGQGAAAGGGAAAARRRAWAAGGRGGAGRRSRRRSARSSTSRAAWRRC